METNNIKITLSDLCSELNVFFKQVGLYFTGVEYQHYGKNPEYLNEYIEKLLNKFGLSDKICQTWSAKYPDERVEHFIGFAPRRGYENYIIELNISKS